MLLLPHQGGGGLPRLTVRQLNRLFAANAITSEQLCLYCRTLAVAGETVWNLNAFYNLVRKERVLEQARLADARRQRGQELSLLDGIPISIKANIAVETQPLTAGSRILGAAAASSPPAVGYNATVSAALLKHCGAILVGTTSMDEFGMGSLGSTVLRRNRHRHDHDDTTSSSITTEPTRNPLPFLERLGGKRYFCSDEQVVQVLSLPMDAILEAHEKILQSTTTTTTSNTDEYYNYYYSAGGSSSGSAASVAHGSSILSLGSDTGGSVRLPAAWCGVTGLKPTYGLLSRHGLVSYASSMDTVGLLAPSVDCAAMALQELVEKQEKEPIRDSTQSSCFARRTLSQHLSSNEEDNNSSSLPLSGLKVGIPTAFSIATHDNDDDEGSSSSFYSSVLVREAWSRTARDLQRLGATVETLPNEVLSSAVVQKSLAAYYVLVSAEASSNLARYDGVRYGVAAAESVAAAENQNNDKDDSIDFGTTSDWSVLERQYAATRTHGFGLEVARRVLCGTFVLSADRYHAYYEAAATLRATLTRQLLGAFENEECHVLLVPTALYPPVALGKMNDNNNNVEGMPQTQVDPTEMFANDVMTVPFSLAGLPAISIPSNFKNCGDNNNNNNYEASPFRPALQLIGPRFGESTILRVAKALEKQQQQQQQQQGRD